MFISKSSITLQSRLEVSSIFATHGQVNPEALEVDHDEEHQQGREQVREVRRVAAVESLLQGRDLVRPMSATTFSPFVLLVFSFSSFVNDSSVTCRFSLF